MNLQSVRQTATKALEKADKKELGGGGNLHNLFLLFHATKYVPLNILKKLLKIINESANFCNLLPVALNININ